MDRAREAVELAAARARSRQMENVEFLVGDPTLIDFHHQFDAIVGRFVLIYYPDPVEAVCRLARHLWPGGLMVFQKFDMDYIRSWPAAPTFKQAARWITQAFTVFGAQIQLGLALYPVFLDQSLPGPSLRLDALIDGRSGAWIYDLTAETIRSLLPVIEETGIATAAEVGLPTLAERIRNEVVTGKGVVLSPALIGAWSRKTRVS